MVAALSAVVLFLQAGWFSEVLRSPDPVAAAYRDWIQFHRTAVWIADGRADDIYPVELRGREGPEVSDGFHFLYPPFVAWITLPLALLSRLVAYLACAAGVAGGTILATLAVLAATRAARSLAPLAVLGVMASAPWNVAVMLGHLSALLVLSPALALLAWARSRPWLVGGALALLLAKPNWGVPMAGFLLVGRQWRMLGGFLVVAVLLVLVSLPLGPGLWSDWARTMVSYQAVIADHVPPWKQATLLATLESLSGRTLSDGLVFVAWAAVSSALLLGAGLAWWRLAGEAHRFPRLMGVALLAILTANPYAYFYDAVLAMPAGLLLWTASSRWRSPLLRRWALAASLATYLWMLAQYLALLGSGPSLAGVGLAVWLTLELMDLAGAPPPARGLA